MSVIEMVTDVRDQVKQGSGAFPVERLPERIRGFVTEVSQALSIDASAVATPLLAIVAGAVGNAARLAVKPGWIEPCILWAVVALEQDCTGMSILGRVLQAATAPLQQMQMEGLDEYEQIRDAYERQLKLWNQRAADWESDREKGGSRYLGRRPKAPQSPHWIIQETSTEQVLRILTHRAHGTLLAREDLDPFMQSLVTSAIAGDSNWARWQAFYHATSVMDVPTQGHLLRTKRSAVSVAGIVTFDTIKRIMTSSADALSDQLLIATVSPTQRKWNDSIISKEALQTIDDMLFYISQLSASEDSEEEDADEQPAVSLTPDAGEIWSAFYERNSGNEALLCHAARLALLFQVIDNAADEFEDPEHVNASEMENGISIAEWFHAQSQALRVKLRTSADDQSRQRLISFITAKGGTVTLRDLMRQGPCYATSELARAALESLSAHGQGSFVPSTRGGQITFQLSQS